MIDNLFKIRADGGRIDARWSLAQLLATGWPPCKVIRLEWTHRGAAVVFDAPFGVICQPTRDHEFLAALLEEETAGLPGRLLILNADGSERGVIPNEQVIDGVRSKGTYQWFEREGDPAIAQSIAVVFCRQADQALFRLLIDASRGATLSITPTR